MCLKFKPNGDCYNDIVINQLEIYIDKMILDEYGIKIIYSDCDNKEHIIPIDALITSEWVITIEY